MSIADAMVRMKLESQRATSELDTLGRTLHDIGSHDVEHRPDELRWCFVGDVLACGCVHDGDRCCARATQEDLLCDRCRRGHGPAGGDTQP
jgi:hypothetical protein